MRVRLQSNRSFGRLCVICRVLVFFATALVVDDRVVHSREESHRFHVVITTDVLQRTVGHGGQVYLIAVGHERFDRFGEHFHAGRVGVLEGRHVEDQAPSRTPAAGRVLTVDHGHSQGGRGRTVVVVSRHLDQLLLEHVPVDYVQTTCVPDDFDVGYFDGDGVQV